MPLDLRLMRYVIAVAENGSFQRAAEQLHMAQPPLSRQVKELERELGVQLFQRRPTRLTGPGRVFVESARKVLADAERTVARTRQASRAAVGTVRVGYGPSAAQEEMPKLFTLLRARHPGIRLESREAWDAELVRALVDGELDAVVGRGLAVPAGYSAETFRREPLCIAIGVEHRLASRPEVALRELRGERLRLSPRGLAPRYHDTVLAALHGTGETFETIENPVPGLRNYLSLRVGGFMVLPRSAGGRLPPGLVCLRIADPLPQVRLEILWRPTGASPAAGALVETARWLAHGEGWLSPGG
jgi:DNA-binding transcriptional LysR family regulator